MDKGQYAWTEKYQSIKQKLQTLYETQVHLNHGGDAEKSLLGAG
jgi:hypothetical protein